MPKKRRRNAGGDFSQQRVDQQAAEKQKQSNWQARRNLAHVAERLADDGNDPQQQRGALDKSDIEGMGLEPVAVLDGGARINDGEPLVGIVAPEEYQRHRQHRPRADD